MAICPWCGALSDGTLCSDCRNQARGLGRLSIAELDALPYGVLHLDREGTILAINETEQHEARVTAGETIGRNFFSEVAPCADVQAFRGRFESFLDSEEVLHEFDFVYRLASGRSRAVKLILARVTGGALVVAKYLHS